MRSQAHILPRHALTMTVKGSGLKKRVADLLISKWGANGMSVVISGLESLSELCPLYPRKQTCAVQLGMSAKGQ
jgi:hypothetical protein